MRVVMPDDLLIKHARICNGTGAGVFDGVVGITDATIAAVENV